MTEPEKINKIRFVSLVAISITLILALCLTALETWYPAASFIPLTWLARFVVVLSIAAWQANRLEGILLNLRAEAKRLHSGKEAFFDEEENSDASFALRSEKFFNKSVLSVFSFAVGIGALISLWFFVSQLNLSIDSGLIDRSGKAAAMLMGVAAGFFLSAAFVSGSSRDIGSAKLRALAGWFYFMAFGLALISVLEFLSSVSTYDFRKQGLYVLVAFVAMLLIEMILMPILEFFRPRHGSEDVFILESRVLTMITSPGGLLHNFAHTIEYQTGIKISEEGPSLVIKKVLLPVIFIQVLWLYLMGCIVEIKPGYAGIRESFGEVSRVASGQAKILTPGLNFKLPWPFGEIKIHNVEKLSTFIVGLVPSEGGLDQAPDMDEDEYKISDPKKILVWGRAAHSTAMDGQAMKDFNYLAADSGLASQDAGKQAPVNMVTVKIPVHYRVKDLYKFLYTYKQPQLVLQALAEREVVHYLGTVDYHDFIGQSRGGAAKKIRQILQAKADEANLGVELLFLEIEASHPPMETVLSYDRVLGAKFEGEAKVLSAQTKAARGVSQAASFEQSILEEAETEKIQHVALARAQSERFGVQARIYEGAPQMFKLVSYLDFVERDLRGVTKYIFNSPEAAKNVIINFETNERTGLLKSLGANLQDKE